MKEWSLHTVGEKGVGISVLDGLGGWESRDTLVAIAEILAERRDNGRVVGELVESGGGLVLSVAAVVEGRKLVVAGAVVDLVLGWEGVGKDTRVATASVVIAEVGGSASGARAGLAGDGQETAGNLLDGAAVSGLEVLAHLAGVSLGSGSGSSGETGRVGESSLEDTKLASAAAGGDDVGALVNNTGGVITAHSLFNSSGLLSINIHGELVGLIESVTGNGGCILLGGRDHSVCLDNDLSATAQVVSSSKIKGVLNTGLGAKVNEELRGEVRHLVAGEHSSELDLSTFCV